MLAITLLNSTRYYGNLAIIAFNHNGDWTWSGEIQGSTLNMGKLPANGNRNVSWEILV